LGLAQDFNEAERWFLRDSGTYRPFSFPRNIWELEELSDEGDVRDYADAKAHYERWAEQGNKLAIANLGFLYLHGLGVKKDVQKSMELFEQAANGGNAYAAYNLGTVYEKGDDGVPPNGNKALEFYQKANAGGKYQASVGLQRLGQLKTTR
jgi:TPR repeat protein